MTLCSLCGGRQHFFTIQDGAFEWWPCPACDAAGTRSLFQPAIIRTHYRPTRADIEAQRRMEEEQVMRFSVEPTPTLVQEPC